MAESVLDEMKCFNMSFGVYTNDLTEKIDKIKLLHILIYKALEHFCIIVEL